MLQTIINFFSSIWDIILSVLNFLESLIKGLWTLIQLLPSVLALTTQSIGYLPSFLIGIATVTVSVLIIFLILGREHGGSS